MNFLEQLTAEWYEYRGYFCRTNIRFGETGHGGHIGEMDVIAYHPKTKEFIHIECSTDAWSWEEKRKVFTKKFQNAEKYYEEVFSFNKKRIKKIAITGFSVPRQNPEKTMDLGNGIKIILIPEFVSSIAEELSKINPWNCAIDESSYPLLRSIQYGTFYLLRKTRKEK